MLLDRLGVGRTLILLTSVPLICFVAVAAYVLAQANDQAAVAEHRSISIGQAVALGRIQSSLLNEALLYELWGNETISSYAMASGAMGETLLKQIRSNTDETIGRFDSTELKPEVADDLDGLLADLDVIRERWDAVDRSIGPEAETLVTRAAAFRDEATRAELIEAGGSSLNIVLFEDFVTLNSLESSLAARLLVEGARSSADASLHDVAAARSDATLDLLSQSTGGAAGQQLLDLIENSSFMETRALVRGLPIDAEPEPVNPAVAAVLLARGSADNDALYQLGLVQVDQALTEAEMIVDEARQARTAVLLAGLAGVILTVLASRLVGGRLNRRIARVADVAAAISAGELDVDEINDTGTDEVAALAGTVDEMSTTLSTVQQQLGALAEEQLEHPVLTTELPGTIGRNLRIAIRRVNNTTTMLRTRAETDGLTGLFNRTALIERAADRPDPAVVAVVDLDGFKAVNDTLGHAAGDDVLINVARQLEQVVRQEDIVGRLGGDEFVIVAWAKPATVEAMAQRLVETLAARTDLGGVSCSVGVAAARSGEPLESVIKRADTAMYEAKGGGRGLVVTA